MKSRFLFLLFSALFLSSVYGSQSPQKKVCHKFDLSPFEVCENFEIRSEHTPHFPFSSLILELAAHPSWKVLKKRKKATIKNFSFLNSQSEIDNAKKDSFYYFVQLLLLLAENDVDLVLTVLNDLRINPHVKTHFIHTAVKHRPSVAIKVIKSAIEKEDLKLLALMISLQSRVMNFNVSSEVELFVTPLAFALQRGSLKVLSLLIQTGANVNEKVLVNQEEGLISVFMADFKNVASYASLFFDNGNFDPKAVFHPKYLTPIHGAVELGLDFSIFDILSRRFSWTAHHKSDPFSNALAVAIKENRVDWARLMIADPKFNPSLRSESGKTYLMYTAEMDSVDILSELIDYSQKTGQAELQITFQDASHFDALDHAIASNSTECIKQILKYVGKKN